MKTHRKSDYLRCPEIEYHQNAIVVFQYHVDEYKHCCIDFHSLDSLEVDKSRCMISVLVVMFRIQQYPKMFELDDELHLKKNNIVCFFCYLFGFFLVCPHCKMHVNYPLLPYIKNVAAVVFISFLLTHSYSPKSSGRTSVIFKRINDL